MDDKDKLTEEKIFEAATEVFIHKGMDGTRMQDIADVAGINKSLLHYYYRTKDRLFNAVFEMIAKKMLQKFAPVMESNLSFEEKITFFYREHISFLQKNPRLPGFLLNEINRHPERLRKFLSSVEAEKFWTMMMERHKEDIERYNIKKEDLPQLISTIVSISVFPFAAKGIMEGIMGSMGIDFNEFLEQRKEFAPRFVVSAIKSMNQTS